MTRDGDTPPVLAGLWPRFGALVYDALLLFGLAFVAAWAFVSVTGDARHGLHRLALQAYLGLASGAYFVACWRRSGQTLAMKTWGLRLVGPKGETMDTWHAIVRYLLATAGLLLAASGFLWALADRDRQFLHDRLLGTRIVRAPI